MKKFLKNSLIALLLLIAMLVGCAAPIEDEVVSEQLPVVENEQEDESSVANDDAEVGDVEEDVLSEDGHYTSKEEVALYIHLYGRLPENFITKKEAKALGWESKEGNLWEVAPGMSIGGDYFGNYEELLPEVLWLTGS